MFPATFRRLEVFIAVVEAGSLRTAADRLGISQPSVSGHIKALEVQLGQTLFERRRGAPSGLTEQGRRLHERAIDIVAQAEALAENLGLPVPTRRRLVLCAQRSVGNFLLSEPLAEFACCRQDIELVIEAGRYEDVVRALLEGRAELGFLLARGQVVDLPSEVVGHTALRFYAAPSHPLARRLRIDVAELVRHPFVVAEQGSRFALMIQSLLQEAGIAGFPVACQAQEVAIVRALVGRGVGLTCSLQCSMAEAVRRGEVVELPVACPPLVVDIRQAFAPRRRPSGPAQDFARALARAGVFG
jgi:DNA-binding transcriptional LysR family regulator